MKIIVFALAAMALLVGCTNDTTGDASIEQVNAAAYRASGPRTITIFTMINNRTGGGGHTAMLVNGSQQVIFDPAGSFRDPRVTERGDVLYGMTPGWVQAYKSAHARDTHHVVSQEIRVTAEQAEQALRLVQANGTVPAAFCASATTEILGKVDGFEFVDKTFYPENLMEQIAKRPGVKMTRYYENDAGDVVDAVKIAQSAE